MDVAVGEEIVARMGSDVDTFLSRIKAAPGEFTFYDIERGASELARQWKLMVSGAAASLETGHQGRYIAGHRDVGEGQHRLKFVDMISRTVQTPDGPVTYERAYYHSKEPNDSRWPRDEQLGLVPLEQRSPELVDLLAYVSARAESYAAAVEVLEKLKGVSIEYKEAQRQCWEIGLELEQQEKTEAQKVFVEKQVPPDPPGPPPEAIIVCADGVTVDHCAGSGMEIKLGRVHRASLQPPPQPQRTKTVKPRRRTRSSEPSTSPERAQELADLKETREQREYGAASGLVRDALHEVAPTRHLEPMFRQTSETSTYRATARLESETFGQSLWLAAHRLGVGVCALVLFLADGSKWCWSLCETHFAGAVQILDVFHVAKHVVLTSNALYGEGSKAAQQWRLEVMTLLLKGGWRTVVEQLGKMTYTSESKRKARRDLIRYLTDNEGRMDYPTYISRGYPISSAMIESACRHVPGVRMKGSGRRWDDDGAEAMAKLRALLCGNEWDRHFEARRHRRLVALRELRKAA
jgi:hypothetical protein